MQLVCQLLPLSRSAHGSPLASSDICFDPPPPPPLLLLCWNPLTWCIQPVLNTKTTPQNYKVSPILQVVHFSLRPAYRTGLDPRRWNPNEMFPHSLQCMYRMTIWEQANRHRQYYEKKPPVCKTSDSKCFVKTAGPGPHLMLRFLSIS